MPGPRPRPGCRPDHRRLHRGLPACCRSSISPTPTSSSATISPASAPSSSSATAAISAYSSAATPPSSLVALLVVSIVPLAAIIVDLFSYTGERLQAEILVDVASAVIGLAISAFFISRSLLRPIGILSRAMTRGRRGRSRGARAGHLERRGRRAHRPVQHHGRGPARARAAARDLRPLCRRERRRHHPAPPGRGRALGRDRRGDHPVHRHRGLHHHRRVPDAGRAGRRRSTTISRPCWRRSARMAAWSTPSSATACSPPSTCRWPARAMPSPRCAPRSTSSAPSAAAPSAIRAWRSPPASASAPDR